MRQMLLPTQFSRLAHQENLLPSEGARLASGPFLIAKSFGKFDLMRTIERTGVLF